MTEQERQEELDAYGGIGTTLLCVGTLITALYGMKKISEHERKKKLTWKEFLFPY